MFGKTFPGFKTVLLNLELPSLIYPLYPHLVGEAVAYAFGGVPVTADRILLSNFSGLAEEFSLLSPQQQQPLTPSADKDGDVDMEGGADGSDVPPAAPAAPKEWGLGLVGSNGDVEATAPAIAAAIATTRSWVMKKLLEEMSVHTRAEVRASASVQSELCWLASQRAFGTP